MSLAGESERHHGAALEGIFEGDDARTLGVSACDFHGVLDSFGTTVDKEGFLWKLARSEFVHALGQADVAFVRRDLDAGVKEAVELVFDSFDHFVAAMAGVGTANAAGEVDVAVAVDVFEPRIFGFGHKHARPPTHTPRPRLPP